MKTTMDTNLIPLLIKHLKEKLTLKVIKDGEKKFSRCFNGKSLITFLKEYYKLDKEDASKLGQELIEEGYFFEITENHPRFKSKFTYSIQKDEGSIFLNSQKLHSQIELLLDDNLFLIKLLLELNEKVDSKELMNMIANYLESKNLTHKFLKDYILIRIKAQKNNFNYFREDGVDSKIFIEVLRIYGKKYLKNLLKPFVNIIQYSSKEFEIDFDNPELEDIFLTSHQRIIKTTLGKLLNDIFRSKDEIPEGIKNIFHFLRKSIAENLNDTKDREHNRKFVGCLFFLRFLAPALTFPEDIFNDLEVSFQERKAFCLIAKLIQCVVNKTRFDDEDKLSFINKVIVNHIEKIDIFCEEISNENKLNKSNDEISGVGFDGTTKRKNKAELILGDKSPKGNTSKISNSLPSCLEDYINIDLMSLPHILSKIIDFIVLNNYELCSITHKNYPKEKECDSSVRLLSLLELFVDYNSKNKNGKISELMKKYNTTKHLNHSYTLTTVISPLYRSPSLENCNFTVKNKEKKPNRKSFTHLLNNNINHSK